MISARTIESWVFDLDNTLYAADSTLYDVIGARMTAYVARVTGLAHDAALALQEHYFHHYGATIVGMVAHHDVDPDDFLHHVHDVDVSLVPPDLELGQLIAALPGRKYVFTNGGGGHAERVVAQLGIAHCFDGLFDISGAGLSPKPQPASYERLLARYDIAPSRAVLVEDTLRNLEPAHALGFKTVLVGAVHPEPRPAYVDLHVPDVKAFLRRVAPVDRRATSA